MQICQNGIAYLFFVIIIPKLLNHVISALIFGIFATASYTVYASSNIQDGHSNQDFKFPVFPGFSRIFLEFTMLCVSVLSYFDSKLLYNTFSKIAIKRMVSKLTSMTDNGQKLSQKEEEEEEKISNLEV